jgi:16S rRNA pseudouridine516 synthase
MCEKVYRVGLSRPVSEDLINTFKEGIVLQGETQLTQPAELTLITPKEVLLTLTEGKFHQVKRMFAAVNNKVISLHRERIGSISLDVPLGKWRHLSIEEVNSFTAQ